MPSGPSAAVRSACRTRRSAATAVTVSAPDTIDGASNAPYPSGLWTSTTVPSSHQSASTAATRTIAASCAAVAAFTSPCSAPATAAHSCRDPATSLGSATEDRASRATATASSTSCGPTVATMGSPSPRTHDPTRHHRLAQVFEHANSAGAQRDWCPHAGCARPT